METQTPRKAELERNLSYPTAPIPIVEMGKWRNRGGVSLTMTFAGTRSTSPESYKSAQSALSQVLGMALIQLNLFDQKC